MKRPQPQPGSACRVPEGASTAARLSLRAAGTFLAGILLVAAAACTAPKLPPVPQPDTAGMEGRVRQRIEQARAAVLEAPESAQAWGTLGNVCDVHELDEAALASYRQARELDPGDPRWPYLIGRLLAIQGEELEAAVAALEAARDLEPGYAPGHLRLADTLAKKGDLEAALEEYRQAIQLEGELAKAHLGQGQVLLRQGKTAQAVAALERARKLAPRDAAVYFALGRAYQLSGEGEAARDAGEAARELETVDGFPDPRLAQVSAEGASSSLLFERATGLLQAGHPARALEDLKAVASLRPRDPYVQRELATAYQSLGQPGPAAAHLEKALELKPELTEWRLQLAAAGSCLASRAAALGQLQKARQAGYDGPRLAPLAGSALARSGNLAGADQAFSEAEADPGELEAQALFDWGNVLAQLGRLPEAEERFRRAIAAAPDLAPAHLSLGLSLEAQGRPEEAIPHYRRAMELEPNPMAAQRLQALGAR